MLRKLDCFIDEDKSWRFGPVKDWPYITSAHKWLFAIGPIRIGWMTDDYLDAIESYR